LREVISGEIMSPMLHVLFADVFAMSLIVF
jgi:hypothetical protein